MRSAKKVESFPFYGCYDKTHKGVKKMEEHREAVQRMQDYIAEHLCENITLADLSEVSLFSPWYSYRLFTQWTNMTPADYIRRFRLSKSALKLRDET